MQLAHARLVASHRLALTLVQLVVVHVQRWSPPHDGVVPVHALVFSDVHSTQVCAVASHAGVAPVQALVLVLVHCTHSCAVVSQAGVPPVQALVFSDVHSTQPSMKHAGLDGAQREHGPPSVPESGLYASGALKASTFASRPGASGPPSRGPESMPGPAASDSTQRSPSVVVPDGHSEPPQAARVSRTVQKVKRMVAIT